MAFIEQRQWTLYLLYPTISYSVPDTMISITIGSVWRGIKICQSLKNLHLGLDIIGRRECCLCWGTLTNMLG